MSEGVCQTCGRVLGQGTLWCPDDGTQTAAADRTRRRDPIPRLRGGKATGRVLVGLAVVVAIVYLAPIFMAGRDEDPSLTIDMMVFLFGLPFLAVEAFLLAFGLRNLRD